MRELAERLGDWRAAGVRFALARIVATTGSAPRPAGTAMAIAEDGEVIGSLSGGCVEAAVHDTALEVLATGTAARSSFGIDAGDLAPVGLMCGGSIDVYVEPVEPDGFTELDVVLDALGSQRAVLLTTDLASGRHSVTTDSTHPESATLQTSSEGEVLVQSFATPPRMLVFGAVDLAEAVASVGRFLGYRVTVCDARPVFATAERFPSADEVVVAWPHRYLAEQYVDSSTVICALTHDHKFDIPLLEGALATNAGYIGVMGSRKTQNERLSRLQQRGLAPEALARLRGPIGLDLGARTPAETAVSVAAEIIAWRHGRSGQPLSDLSVPIHDVPASALICGP